MTSKIFGCITMNVVGLSLCRSVDPLEILAQSLAHYLLEV